MRDECVLVVASPSYPDQHRAANDYRKSRGRARESKARGSGIDARPADEPFFFLQMLQIITYYLYFPAVWNNTYFINADF
jgi:hypothetical protein